jgi:hypothetical protein
MMFLNWECPAIFSVPVMAGVIEGRQAKIQNQRCDRDAASDHRWSSPRKNRRLGKGASSRRAHTNGDKDARS